MPYNNYFPASYQPIYYQQQYQPVQQMPVQNVPQVQPQTQQAQSGQSQPMSSSIIWVYEKDVDNYLVAPNTAVELWDREKRTIYIKSADAMGMTSVKILDYTIRNVDQNNVSMAPNFNSETFATKDEVNALSEQIAALRGDFEGLTKRSAGRPKKEATENE